MAAELLFPIDDIDLTATVVTPDEVAAINPQCGDMRQLDRVIWFNHDRSQGLGIKAVRDDEFWVPGHIPGRPLYPGVMMIEAAAQLSSVVYRLKSQEDRFLGFTRCDDVVFRGQVEPGMDLLLMMQEVSFRRRRFITLTQGAVDGELVFEAKITGMVI